MAWNGKLPPEETRFKPGVVSNPNGRPRGSKNRSTIVRTWLEAKSKIKNPLTGEEQELTQEDIMTLALINKARKGDVAAYTALMDSAFGKATQKIEEESTVKHEIPMFKWAEDKSPELSNPDEEPEDAEVIEND